ncbi:hypothetical protein Rhopal_007325-T1 [Rhodotorula paludigena]|uniref:HhH-GPD domain-containing protein n=1 Tax=Rhodotorula paludigena TaxID=86838 RepID=A0AAV5GPF4_9BASI|nr:hypothetical protein Rhopal_007325-T1 [Rhodotorula paludigena]
MPDRPTADECTAVHRALIDCHGKPPAPENMQFEDDEEGGPVTDNGICSSNYRVGKRGLDERFGRANYEAIRQAPLEDVVEALRPGGLANVKGKRLKQMLNDVYARNGQNKLSLEDLHGLPAPEAKASLLALHGVGPKVAACVMAYRLGLHEFAVDTHVLRITKRLGWVSQKSDGKQAYEHLNARIPDELKHDVSGHATNAWRAAQAQDLYPARGHPDHHPHLVIPDYIKHLPRSTLERVRAETLGAWRLQRSRAELSLFAGDRHVEEISWGRWLLRCPIDVRQCVAWLEAIEQQEAWLDHSLAQSEQAVSLPFPVHGVIFS